MLKPVLRHLPQTQTLPPFRLAFRGQRDVAPSTILCALTQDNESLALKRPQIVTERRTIWIRRAVASAPCYVVAFI